MKAIKLVLSFLIVYFILTAYNGIIELARNISLGNRYVEYGIYAALLLVTIWYLLVPLIRYLSRPSTKYIERMFHGDKKAILKVWRYYKRTLPEKEQEEFARLSKNDTENIRAWIIRYLMNQIGGFDSIIDKTAMKLTVTVMMSPNPFIDGITILISNSRLIFKLSQMINFRYSWREIVDMYFKVFSMASISGLIEEYDDEIMDIAEDVAEEFSEHVLGNTAETGGGGIPIVKGVMSVMSPILQAAGNYAFILYNGKRFKYSVMNLLREDKLSEDEIRRSARKEALSLRHKFVFKMSGSYMKKVPKLAVEKIKSLNPFHKGDKEKKDKVVI
jgi:hypothetical protein